MPSLYQRGNTMDQWAESLLAELEGPFDCCVGASMGGGAALALERQRTGFLRALVFAGAHAGPDAPEHRPRRERQLEEYRDDPDKRAVVEALRDRPDDRVVLASFAGPVLVVVGSGDEWSLADIAYVPWVLRARDLLNVSLEPWPEVAAWVDRQAERPSVAAELDVVAAL